MRTNERDEMTPETAESGRGQTDRKAQVIELLVFLFLIVPSMVISFFAVRQGNMNFVLVAVSTIVRDLSLVSLILYFAWRNNEPPARLGWSFRNGWSDVSLGIFIFIPFFFLIGLLGRALEFAGLSAPSTQLPSFLTARGWSEFILAGFLVVIVALTEETIFRGYLVLRFKAATGSFLAAAFLSSIIFSLGHGYEGAAGVVTVGIMGFIFALIYIWRRSLVAPMVMHFLQDFIGIVLLPMLGLG